MVEEEAEGRVGVGAGPALGVAGGGGTGVAGGGGTGGSRERERGSVGVSVRESVGELRDRVGEFRDSGGKFLEPEWARVRAGEPGGVEERLRGIGAKWTGVPEREDMEGGVEERVSSVGKGAVLMG